MKIRLSYIDNLIMKATILDTQDSTQFDSGEGHPNWYVCRPLSNDEDEKIPI